MPPEQSAETSPTGASTNGEPVRAGAAWITTTQAAQRLGVKRATLYSYVSRGVLRSERRPGQQESLFDRAQVEAMASASRRPGTTQPLLRFRSVATAVSGLRDGALYVRDAALARLAAEGDLEAAVRLVLGLAPGSGPLVEVTPPPRTAAPLLKALPLTRRLPAAVQLLGSADPIAYDLSPESAARSAHRVVTQAVLLIGDGRTEPLERGIGRLLSGRDLSAAESRCLATLLIVLLDHGLTASTIAARVAASTRAPVHDCLLAAYATMAGPLHGAASLAAHDLLSGFRAAATERVPADALVRVMLRHRSLPGFGHVVYEGADPRVEMVLDALWALPDTAPLRADVEELVALVGRRTGAWPNVDLAIAALAIALGMPAEAGLVLFQVARSFGVAAHVIEEYAEQPLRWRGQQNDG
jgi:citrate synthase